MHTTSISDCGGPIERADERPDTDFLKRPPAGTFETQPETVQWGKLIKARWKLGADALRIEPSGQTTFFPYMTRRDMTVNESATGNGSSPSLKLHFNLWPAET
ncbi:hypothetical protein GWI33_011727 [Rhynchophorus ferrugineus]|uniref:Uncharacterized protein n=1 Tax=Rhynchophorus ferrugineus TaxID=354439 RepID=A0A834IWL4_RHYFE|nr:hypothetical protein GWI33_011727 [Rhynchophorus ferrugineus]